MITGVNHITISVADLGRSFLFYKDVLGFKPLAKWLKGAYFLCGDTWFCLSLDQETRTGPLNEYTHVAFHIAPEHFGQFRSRLRQMEVQFWKENTSEGDSLYFLDPDGHKLEVHVTTWVDRITFTKTKPYAGMKFFI